MHNSLSCICSHHPSAGFFFSAQVSSIPIVDDNRSLLDLYSRRYLCFFCWKHIGNVLWASIMDLFFLFCYIEYLNSCIFTHTPMSIACWASTLGLYHGPFLCSAACFSYFLKVLWIWWLSCLLYMQWHYCLGKRWRICSYSARSNEYASSEYICFCNCPTLF